MHVPVCDAISQQFCLTNVPIVCTDGLISPDRDLRRGVQLFAKKKNIDFLIAVGDIWCAMTCRKFLCKECVGAADLSLSLSL